MTQQDVSFLEYKFTLPIDNDDTLESLLEERKIPIIDGNNDSPSTEGDPDHPNGSLYAQRLNLVVEELYLFLIEKYNPMIQALEDIDFSKPEEDPDNPDNPDPDPDNGSGGGTQGPQGPQGPQGLRGQKGEKGDIAIVAIQPPIEDLLPEATLTDVINKVNEVLVALNNIPIFAQQPAIEELTLDATLADVITAYNDLLAMLREVQIIATS